LHKAKDFPRESPKRKPEIAGSLKWVHLGTVLSMGGEMVPHRQKAMQETGDQKSSKAVGYIGRRGTGSGG